MKKLSVKDLVDFRAKSDRAKRTLVERIKSNKIEPPAEGGGNYWVTSFSAICNSYRSDDLTIIDQKIDQLRDKLASNRHANAKNMYERNIMNLKKYKGIDVKKLRPSGKLSFLKKSSGNQLLTIKGLQIEAKASHVFTFGKKDEENVGAIWFVAKISGFRIEEVGMFCEMLYRFLKHNYSKKYQVSSKYCMAVDMLSGQVVNYKDIEDGRFSPIFSSTLDDINKLM